MVASSDGLISSQGRTPYLLVRVLDQKLLKSLEGYKEDGKNEDRLGVAYRAMTELDRPFNALLLERIPHHRVYRRVASSHTITAWIQSIATSKLTTINVV